MQAAWNYSQYGIRLDWSDGNVLLPDMRTIYFIDILVNLMLAVLMLIYWRTQKTYQGFGIMTMTNVLLVITYIMFALRGVIPEAVSILSGNLATGLAVVCRYEGIARFVGDARPLRRHAWLMAILLLFIAFFTFVENNPLIRAVGMTAYVCYYLFRIQLSVYHSKPPQGKFLLRTMAAFLLIHLILIGSRAVYWLVNPDVMTLYSSTLANIGFFLYDLLNQIGMTVLYIMLTGQRMAGELTEMQHKLETLAMKDALTGFYNNRAFSEIGQKELIRSRRFDHPLSLLLIDVDNFKNINDSYGHVAGDRVLAALAGRMELVARHSDILGRMGGDEFFLLLPETVAAHAIAVAERFQAELAETPIQWEEKAIPVTISIGVASLISTDDEFEALLKRADDALYEAKRTGRNRVVAR